MWLALTRGNIKWLLTRPEKKKSNQICFSSILGKIFQLTEFQAKLFLMRNWVGGFNRDRLSKVFNLSLGRGYETSTNIVWFVLVSALFVLYEAVLDDKKRYYTVEQGKKLTEIYVCYFRVSCLSLTIHPVDQNISSIEACYKGQ